MKFIKTINRVCFKCGLFLKVTTPSYFKKKIYKCTGDCKSVFSFKREFSCPDCSDGKLVLKAEGFCEYKSSDNNKMTDFIYVCDICDAIHIHDELIAEN